MKKPTAFAIFAHPDDESFGPGGTIALLSKTHDTYLFCATKGEAGEDYSKQNGMSLPEKREQELQAASAILGIKEVLFLGYQDGHINQSIYHEIAEKINMYVKKLKPDRIITYEPRGISGHIDHAAMSLISSFIYIKNKCIKELHYYCLDKKQRGNAQKYFIYFPPGYDEKEISRRVDIISVLNKKIEAIKKYVTQLKDVKKMLKLHKTKRIDECFIILKK